MDSLEEGRHKEVRKLRETTVNQILESQSYIQNYFKCRRKNTCIFGFSEKSPKCLTQPDIMLAKENSICSQKTWFGFEDSVGNNDFSRGNAAFNNSHENTG